MTVSELYSLSDYLRRLRDSMEKRFGNIQRCYYVDTTHTMYNDIQNTGYVPVSIDCRTAHCTYCDHDMSVQGDVDTRMALLAMEFALSSVSRDDNIIWLGSTRQVTALLAGIHRLHIRIATFDNDITATICLSDPHTWYQVMGPTAKDVEIKKKSADMDMIRPLVGQDIRPQPLVTPHSTSSTPTTSPSPRRLPKLLSPPLCRKYKPLPRPPTAATGLSRRPLPVFSGKRRAFPLVVCEPVPQTLAPCQIVSPPCRAAPRRFVKPYQATRKSRHEQRVDELVEMFENIKDI